MCDISFLPLTIIPYLLIVWYLLILLVRMVALLLGLLLLKVFTNHSNIVAVFQSAPMHHYALQPVHNVSAHIQTQWIAYVIPYFPHPLHL